MLIGELRYNAIKSLDLTKEDLEKIFAVQSEIIANLTKALSQFSGEDVGGIAMVQ